MTDYRPDRERWRRHFDEIIVSGDAGEVDAATDAAAAAMNQGASEMSAKTVGEQAARRYREDRELLYGRAGGAGPGTVRAESRTAWAGPGADRRPGSGAAQTRPADRGEWSADLAARLFAIPARWGWQPPAVPAVAAPGLAVPGPRPVWLEPPRPDTRELSRARSTAVTRLVWRLAFTVIVVVAFIVYGVLISQKVQGYGSSATQVYGVVVLVVAALVAISLIRAVARVIFAGRAIREFEQPYRELRAAEKQRHDQAVADWQEATRRNQSLVAEAKRQSDGPQWFPVLPASEPMRVDVLGGDPRRNGWASLLVTLGTSVLSSGHHITVLDLTGQDVGGGLLMVAEARGLQVDLVELPEDGGQIDLLADVPPSVLPDVLAEVLSSRSDDEDARHERALASDVISRMAESLDSPVTFSRLAAGAQVLRQATPDPGVLSTEEITRLAAHVGEVGRDEWTGKQLYLMASQLAVLGEMSPGATGRALWTGNRCAVVATVGARDDRKVLLDRLLVELAERALRPGGYITGFIVVAGADHLGAATLRQLSDHALHSGVRLLLMIDQSQGDLEKTLGTGGAVCVMKAYNHKDAGLAADFIGRDHKFVVSQITRQVGKTFTDGGGDSFGASTSRGTSAKRGFLRERGLARDLTNSRGHTWTAVRNWSTADNVSDSRTESRVYEFTVDPQQILGMPETAFILVDNTGNGRRVIMADCYPGICLLDRVSLAPADDPAR